MTPYIIESLKIECEDEWANGLYVSEFRPIRYGKLTSVLLSELVKRASRLVDSWQESKAKMIISDEAQFFLNDLTQDVKYIPRMQGEEPLPFNPHDFWTSGLNHNEVADFLRVSSKMGMVDYEFVGCPIGPIGVSARIAFKRKYQSTEFTKFITEWAKSRSFLLMPDIVCGQAKLAAMLNKPVFKEKESVFNRKISDMFRFFPNEVPAN